MNLLIYFIYTFITNEIEINKEQMRLYPIDRIRMLDNDLIRLSKLNTVFRYKKMKNAMRSQENQREYLNT